MEHFEILQVNDKPNFFVTHADIPFKIADYTLESYVKQMRYRVLDVMKEKLGADTSDEALRKAVEEHNEVCRILTEIGEMRKMENRSQSGFLHVPEGAYPAVPARDACRHQKAQGRCEALVPRPCFHRRQRDRRSHAHQAH